MKTLYEQTRWFKIKRDTLAGRPPLRSVGFSQTRSSFGQPGPLRLNKWSARSLTGSCTDEAHKDESDAPHFATQGDFGDATRPRNIQCQALAYDAINFCGCSQDLFVFTAFIKVVREGNTENIESIERWEQAEKKWRIEKEELWSSWRDCSFVLSH